MGFITVSVNIKAPIELVWACFSEPKHIVSWNFATDDWHCPQAKNDFQEQGSFSWTMAAKDGSFSFDFEGTFTKISPFQTIEYQIMDGRKVQLSFQEKDGQVLVVENFEPENQNPEDMQMAGWQAILNQFKKYVEEQA